MAPVHLKGLRQITDTSSQEELKSFPTLLILLLGEVGSVLAVFKSPGRAVPPVFLQASLNGDIWVKISPGKPAV